MPGTHRKGQRFGRRLRALVKRVRAVTLGYECCCRGAVGEGETAPRSRAPLTARGSLAFHLWMAIRVEKAIPTHGMTGGAYKFLFFSEQNFSDVGGWVGWWVGHVERL